MGKYIDPKANTYSLIKFQSKYGPEQACEQALFQLGFKCPHMWVTQFYCCTWPQDALISVSEVPPSDRCNHWTIMENTKLSLVKWFLALYFMAFNDDGISAMALAKYIDITLKTAWALLHKIRSAMGKRENITSSTAPSKWMKPFSEEKQRVNV